MTTNTLPSPSSPDHYQVHHLPHPCPSFLAGQFVSLRLRAHSLSPTSFASTFAQESSRPASQWTQLLSRPHFHVFILVRHPSVSPSSNPSEATAENEPFSPSQGEWLGHLSLLGPLPKSTFDVPDAQAPDPSLPDAIESKWHLTALWTDPRHRGRGLASQLIQAALRFAADYVPSPPPPPPPASADPSTATAPLPRQARIRINTSDTTAEKAAVLAMWRGKWGFRNGGRACLAVAMQENGDEDFVPEEVKQGGGEREKWWNWYAVSLVRVVERGELREGG
ncbi:MAG: hypothetical protein Q9160_003074 [Pyrenula sp. 1 TL-2023]